MDTDAVLLQRYAECRDAEAFAEIVRRHAGLVYGACLRVTGNRSWAEDVSQECFMALAREAHCIRASLPGWLHQAAVHRALMLLRSESRRRDREDRAQDLATSRERDGAVTWAEVGPYVDEALAQLPESLREPLVLHFLEQKTQAETAAELGVDRSTVSRRIAKGVALLRSRLKEAGVIVPMALLGTFMAQYTAQAAPAALNAALGKMAIAGVGGMAQTTGGMAAAATSSATATTGGLGMKLAVTTVVVTTLAIGALAVHNSFGQKPAPTRSPAPAPPAPATPIAVSGPTDEPRPAHPELPLLPPVMADPLVHSVLQMGRFIEDEMKADRRKVSAIKAEAIQVNDEDSFRAVALIHITPEDLRQGGDEFFSRETRRLSLGRTELFAQVECYDLSGLPIPVVVERSGERRGYYHLEMPAAPAAGEPLRFIARIVARDPLDLRVEKDGVLRHVIFFGGDRHFLDYRQIVLPKSAIMVDAWPKPLCVETVGGRTAVTMRAYAEDVPMQRYVYIAFLWPEKDGVSQKDLPPQYRGLRDMREAKLSEKYERAMQKVLAGGEHHDQSTPLDALLTWRCAILRNDGALFTRSVYRSTDPAAGGDWPDHVQFIDHMTFLNTPPWPEQPAEGYIHPVHMAFPGTFLHCDTHAVIFHQGKWLVMGSTGRHLDRDISRFEKER